MTAATSTSHSSDSDSIDRLTVTAAEQNPFGRFNDLLASYSDPNEPNPLLYQQSLVTFLQRYLNHMSEDQRQDHLYRFGAANVHIESLVPIVSSHEDIFTLFHSTELSTSILLQLRFDQTKHRHLVNLSKLSELRPLISIDTLSNNLSFLFHSFLSDSQPYLENDNPNLPSSFSAFMNILCNEYLACTITGCRTAARSSLLTDFPALIEEVSFQLRLHQSPSNIILVVQKLIKISQNESDPVMKMAAFINSLTSQIISATNDDESHSMTLLSQCLQHTATFLNSNPHHIETFLEKIDLPSSLSYTPFHHDRHLSLIAILSQTDSPLFTKLSEPLLDPTFPLRSLLTPRSFTDPASSFFHLASTNPAFFHRIILTHVEHIVDVVLSTVLSTVLIVSDDSFKPSCIEFGRATENLIYLFGVLTKAKVDLKLDSDNSSLFASSLLTLLVLAAASTNKRLSSAAVYAFSSQFDLSEHHTQTLLFNTPTTFAVGDPFAQWSSRLTPTLLPLLLFAAVRIVTTPLVGLITLADISLRLAFFFHQQEQQQPTNLASSVSPLDRNMSEVDVERRDVVCLHLFPFIPVESQTLFLASFNAFHKSMQHVIHGSLVGVVECLIEMATVTSYDTPIALLTAMKKVAEVISNINQSTSSEQPNPQSVSPFEQAIVEKLKAAEGEERWKLLTQLIVVARDTPDIANELTRAENDAQALLILSVHTIRSSPPLNFNLDTNPETFNHIVQLAGHINNLPLVAMSLFHIADNVFTFVRTVPDESLLITQTLKLQELILNTLREIAPLRREGVEEGWIVGKDDVTSQIVDSCLTVLSFLILFDTFDPTPFVDSLVSLVVTADLHLLLFILLVLQQIEERTQNTSTPFSISKATAPFRGIHESSVTQQPLLSIVSSILLSVSLSTLAVSDPQMHFHPSSEMGGHSPQVADPSLLSQFLPGMNQNLISEIAMETVKSVCLILEERRANTSQALTSDDSSGITLNHEFWDTTPQQLFLALHNMIFPNDPTSISASTLIPLAPFLTRILTIVVPSTTDRVEILVLQDEQEQLLNSFLSLVLSLINTGTPSTLSTPPLSPLLSVLSIALVRLDTIPYLNLYTRFSLMFRRRGSTSNPNVRLFVLALCEEGMEDRNDLTQNLLSLEFQNKWKGANIKPSEDVWFQLKLEELRDSDDTLGYTLDADVFDRLDQIVNDDFDGVPQNFDDEEMADDFEELRQALLRLGDDEMDDPELDDFDDERLHLRDYPNDRHQSGGPAGEL
ncbi:hypothetical protein BLNAU_7271 [Blattamonas nauphoetae]|uniref:Uncharacterized protein n=1 Tax=Blattamonas nauphoetae TaxID=2049346 RepID=A0ABQ9Y266_9EUKA|nr:hypothetical protein BLNAU_7271 [Blattamonas nauphoetae]